MLVKPARARASALFRASFGAPPVAAASAPGRINLIGEHTDYNGGPVLPIALAQRTVVAAGRAEPGVLEAVSERDGRVWRHIYNEGRPHDWSAYVAGVVAELQSAGALPWDAGVRVAVASDVPVGAGLSSSAALTVATTRALLGLANGRLTPRQVAGVAYRAEHNYVGVRCGVMDQSIAALGKPGHALLIESASLATKQIPFHGRLLLVDTGVRHELAASAYNQRRAECEAAVARLKLDLPEIMWLATWPMSWLGRLRRALPQPLRNRALHVVGETARTRFAAQLLARRRLQRFGALMYESHESCRRLYECSAPELDTVVAAAKRAGAWGARMTGAGWGGAVLVLTGKAGAQQKADGAVAAAIRKAFRQAHGREPAISVVRTGGGARAERV